MSKPVTVADLIETLSEMDPNLIVICQSDSEGNSYSPLASVYEANYEAETTYSGEIVEEGGQPALVLAPTN